MCLGHKSKSDAWWKNRAPSVGTYCRQSNTDYVNTVLMKNTKIKIPRPSTSPETFPPVRPERPKNKFMLAYRLVIINWP